LRGSGACAGGRAQKPYTGTARDRRLPPPTDGRRVGMSHFPW